MLRPNIKPVIESDMALLRVLAGWVEKFSADGRRLKPREVVAEFDKYLHDELDLVREAANCSQLRRNFAGSPLLYMPEVHWDWCEQNVMVMERLHATPVSQVDTLREAGVDIKSSRAMAWKSSSRKCSAMVSSMPTCIRAISPCAPMRRIWASMSVWTSASSAR